MPNHTSDANIEVFTFTCERGHVHVEAELNSRPVGDLLEDLEQALREATLSPAEYIALTSALLCSQVRTIRCPQMAMTLLKVMAQTCSELANEIAASTGAELSLPCYTYHGDPVSAAGLTPEPAPAELRAMVQRREKLEATDPSVIMTPGQVNNAPDGLLSMLKEVFGSENIHIIDLTKPEDGNDQA